VVPSSSSVVLAALHRLREQLVERSYVVELDVTTVCGEPDIRLRVCRREQPDVTVELLAPDATIWSCRCWTAVRDQHGQRRLWLGPDQACSLAEVAAFVCALVRLPAAQLAERYVDAG
jgi:hypothetical protein